jgi:hypothetical protein
MQPTMPHKRSHGPIVFKARTHAPPVTKTPSEPQQTSSAVGWIIVFVVIVLISHLANPHAGDELGAEWAAQDAVKLYLRAPTTASFTETHFAHPQNSTNDYVFWGLVDAQNAFGATIRTKWVCKVHRGSDGKWEADRPDFYTL